MGYKTQISATILLPENFRTSDFFALHQRDREQIAEKLEQNTLYKGMYWADLPACLSVHLTSSEAYIELNVDGELQDKNDQSLISMVKKMLGLWQPIEQFERIFCDHPQIGLLVTKNSGLRVPQAATPFEALCWAIIGQQISVSVATSIRRKLIQLVSEQHSDGLWCFPTAQQLQAVTEEQLVQVGCSHNKARTLISVSKQITDNQIDLDMAVNSENLEQMQNQLLKIKGIGQWTVNYVLLRGFGWLDGSLHGDVAVRRNIQTLLGLTEKVNADDAQAWLLQFSPWRALVAAHLWAQQSVSGY